MSNLINEKSSNEEIQNLSDKKDNNESFLKSRRGFFSVLSIPILATMLVPKKSNSADLFLTSTSDANALCKCIQPSTIESIYLKKTEVAADSAKLNGLTSSEIINETLNRAKILFDTPGFSSVAKEGNINNVNGRVYIYASGGWRQIFPAVYS